MIHSVYKAGTDKDNDIFSYRDEYNEEHITIFPKFWCMSEEDVEKHLNN